MDYNDKDEPLKKQSVGFTTVAINGIVGYFTVRRI
jgi:hypothetical protein